MTNHQQQPQTTPTPTGLRRLQPRSWPAFAALLALVVAVCGGTPALLIFGLGQGDGHHEAYQQDVGFLLGDALETALEREARRRAGLGGDASGADVGTDDEVADLPPGEGQ